MRLQKDVMTFVLIGIDGNRARLRDNTGHEYSLAIKDGINVVNSLDFVPSEKRPRASQALLRCLKAAGFKEAIPGGLRH